MQDSQTLMLSILMGFCVIWRQCGIAVKQKEQRNVFLKIWGILPPFMLIPEPPIDQLAALWLGIYRIIYHLSGYNSDQDINYQVLPHIHIWIKGYFRQS